MAVKDTPEKTPATKAPATVKAPEPTKTPAPAAKQPQAAFFVYIGPDIRGLISKNAIYRKDEMKRLDPALEKHPDIKHLLIPGEQLGAARETIRKPDSYLAMVYDRLANRA